MTLDELALAHPHSGPLAVPDWTLGCFHRRSITFATGHEDASTRVVWVQSHGLTGDIRVPASRPAPDADRLEDCSREVLIELVKAEGFAARTAWSDGQMSWDAFAAFQPYDKWPEPGVLFRTGPCLIERAPSGVYVEDWRFQPGGDGLLAGLRLVSENGRPREGALIAAGDHALLVLARSALLPAAPLHEQMAAAADPAALAREIFQAEVSYARRRGEGWEVVLSTNPFREGRPLLEGAFEPGAGLPEVVERMSQGLRRWSPDTLRTGVKHTPHTPAEPPAIAWLSRESSTLLA